MSQVFADSINNNPIYATRAEQDQNGLNIDQTYAKKSELPTVNDGTLTIQKNGATVDTFTANSSSDKTVNIEVPTKTSDLTNDSGFITASDIPAQVQSNWNETDTSDPSYIQNKPSIPPAQVNSDWNSSSGVSQILNKPSIPSKTSDLTNDSGYITTSDVPAAQVQSDWTESDTTDPAYIQNKPSEASIQQGTGISITEANGVMTISSTVQPQVNSDWNASSGVSQILNKPSIPTATSDLTNDSGFITSSDIPAQVQSDWTESDSSSAAYIKHKPSIPAAQVNADWNASSGVAEILHKPSIPSKTSDLTNDSGFITSSDVPAQVNADWNSSSGVSEILNKPTLAAIATSGSYNDLTDKPDIGVSTYTSVDYVSATYQSGFVKIGSIYFHDPSSSSSSEEGSNTVLSFNLEVFACKHNFSDGYVTTNGNFENYTVSVNATQKYVSSSSSQGWFYSDGFERKVSAKVISGYRSSSTFQLSKIQFTGSKTNQNVVDIWLQMTSSLVNIPDTIYATVSSANGSYYLAASGVEPRFIGIAYLDNGTYVNGVRLVDRCLASQTPADSDYFKTNLSDSNVYLDVGYTAFGNTLGTASDVTGAGVYGRTTTGWQAITIPTYTNWKTIFNRTTASSTSYVTTGMSMITSSAVETVILTPSTSSGSPAIPSDFLSMPAVRNIPNAIYAKVSITVELLNDSTSLNSNIYEVDITPDNGLNSDNLLGFDPDHSYAQVIQRKPSNEYKYAKSSIEFDNSYQHSELLHLEYTGLIVLNGSSSEAVVDIKINGIGTAIKHKVQEMVIETIQR